MTREQAKQLAERIADRLFDTDIDRESDRVIVRLGDDQCRRVTCVFVLDTITEMLAEATWPAVKADDASAIQKELNCANRIINQIAVNVGMAGANATHEDIERRVNEVASMANGLHHALTESEKSHKAAGVTIDRIAKAMGMDVLGFVDSADVLVNQAARLKKFANDNDPLFEDGKRWRAMIDNPCNVAATQTLLDILLDNRNTPGRFKSTFDRVIMGKPSKLNHREGNPT